MTQSLTKDPTKERAPLKRHQHFNVSLTSELCLSFKYDTLAVKMTNNGSILPLIPVVWRTVPRVRCINLIRPSRWLSPSELGKETKNREYSKQVTYDETGKDKKNKRQSKGQKKTIRIIIALCSYLNSRSVLGISDYPWNKVESKKDWVPC